MKRLWQERKQGLMRLCWKGWAAAVLLAAPLMSQAATCTTQAELAPQDRSTLAALGQQLATAVQQQDYALLQSDLLPAISQQWEQIRGAVEDGAPLLKGGQIQLRNLYLLDATKQNAPIDTQFFCSNASGSLTVTITMRSLPPGRYAVVLADAAGAPQGGQIGLIFVWDSTSSMPRWTLGGVSIRQGILDGHDGVWYWGHARELAADNAPWSAWYSYEMARYLLLPVDFISSPNLQKLELEQSQIKGSPADAFPYTITDGARSWKIDSIHVNTVLHEPDLAVTYESIGITDPAAERTEAVAVLGALLKARPELRQNFHGLWALASKDGKITPIIELPMAQIP
jgi:hypothetical protein